MDEDLAFSQIARAVVAKRRKGGNRRGSSLLGHVRGEVTAKQSGRAEHGDCMCTRMRSTSYVADTKNTASYAIKEHKCSFLAYATAF